MALFVHLTSEKNLGSILRSGIKPSKVFGNPREGFEKVVFATPVTRDFYASHQWLRELKRSGQRTLVGVYFRIPDDQLVLVGHYNANHAEMPASEACGLVFNAEDIEGYEVLIPRKVQASEVEKTRSLPQVLGWRYYPGAKGKKPCGCPFCTRGEIKSRRIRESYERSFED